MTCWVRNRQVGSASTVEGHEGAGWRRRRSELDQFRGAAGAEIRRMTQGSVGSSGLAEAPCAHADPGHVHGIRVAELAPLLIRMLP